MKNPFTIVCSNTQFTLLLDMQVVLKIINLKTSETKKMYYKAQCASIDLINGVSKYPAAQEKFNQLQK